MRKLIRTDGTTLDLPTGRSIKELSVMINADILDTVSLHHMGQPLHVMILDDLGHDKGLPVNPEATKLYWANCKPGTTHNILGDVIVVPDEDFPE
jgi:hypothetical protein